MKDKRLEELSEMVRLGQPIGFAEALEVIEYQRELRVSKKRRSFLARLFRFFGKNVG